MFARACCVATLAMMIACKPSKPRSGPDVELEKAAEQLADACQSGSAASCLELRRVLDESRATGSARATGVKVRARYNDDWLARNGCKAGHAPSCYEAAQRQPIRQRKSDFERGCTLGHAPSCRELGDWIVAGHFGSARLDEARLAYEHGCSLGDRAACDGVEKVKQAEQKKQADELERAGQGAVDP